MLGNNRGSNFLKTIYGFSVKIMLRTNYRNPKKKFSRKDRVSVINDDYKRYSTENQEMFTTKKQCSFVVNWQMHILSEWKRIFLQNNPTFQ